jgi:hypothetical protein
MITRRSLAAALPLLLPAAGGAAAPPGRHCGDPGGRFIACEAVATELPLRGDRPPGCPVCGRQHAAAPPE